MKPESKETPEMEVKSHSPRFLKKAASMAKRKKKIEVKSAPRKRG